MKFEQLKPGMTVYDVHSYRMGNTTRRSLGVWTVRIVNVDVESQSVLASWNNNPTKIYRRCDWSKWKINVPVLVKTPFGIRRRETREERKARLARAETQNHNEAQ